MVVRSFARGHAVGKAEFLSHAFHCDARRRWDAASGAASTASPPDILPPGLSPHKRAMLGKGLSNTALDAAVTEASKPN